MLAQHMAPQVSLFQPVSGVKRLTHEYRLADYNEADVEGRNAFGPPIQLLI